MIILGYCTGGGGKTSCSKDLRAFTLAEVLITLGIIGVVASMTLPTLIQNHQKSVALNRLRQTYSQIQNAVELIAAEYDGGPMEHWSCPSNDPDTGINYTNASLYQRCFYIAMKKIAVKMYPRPDDVSHAFCYEGREYRPYTAINGERGRWNTNGQLLHVNGYSAKLPNGACVVWHPGTTANDASGLLIIDVDGSYSGYNRSGRDVYVFSYLRNGNNASLGKHGRSIFPGRTTGDTPKTRTQLLQGCNRGTGANGFECSALIVNDSWQMKSDYPW